MSVVSQGRKPCYFGYGLLEAWVFVSFIMSSGSSSVRDSVVFAVGMLVVIVAFAACGVASKRIGLISKHPVVGACAAVIVTASSLLTAFAQSPFAFVILSSICNAWLWLAWGEVFSRVDAEGAESISLGSACVVAVAVIVCTLIPAGVATILASLFPIVSYGMFLLSMRDLGPLDETVVRDRPQQTSQEFRKGLGVRLVLGIGGPSAAIFLFVGMVLQPASGVVSWGVIPAGLAIFILAFVLYIRHTPTLGVDTLFIVMGGFAVITCVLYGLVCPLAIVSMFIIAGWLSQDMLCWLLFARMYREGYSDCIRTFAFGQSIMFASAAFGSLTAIAVDLQTALDTTSVCLLVVGLLFVVVLVLRLLSRPIVKSDGEQDVNEVSGPSQDELLSSMCDTYGLSKREREVFFLLAVGRSAPFIRDELFISESTVRTHIKHIHAKLGVTTKQEMISLIEKYADEYGEGISESKMSNDESGS